MEGIAIFEGKVIIDPETGKVYLESNNKVVDVNRFMSEETGSYIKVHIEAGEIPGEIKISDLR